MLASLGPISSFSFQLPTTLTSQPGKVAKWWNQIEFGEWVSIAVAVVLVYVGVGVIFSSNDEEERREEEVRGDWFFFFFLFSETLTELGLCLISALTQ